MLKAGYTAVGEFHYLHHGPGRLAPTPTWRRCRGACSPPPRDTGIGITLLPVLYGHGGFGGAPPGEGSAASSTTPEALLASSRAWSRDHRRDRQVLSAGAPFPARGQPGGAADDRCWTGLRTLDGAKAPVHIHIAEQGQGGAGLHRLVRPAAGRALLSRAEVGARWCLVHATHVTEEETAALAASGAVAGLCPTTEANLGDGLFDGPRLPGGAGGRLGIGSDSHISVSPWEELRWLEYGQRLRDRGRNLLARVAATTSAPASGRRPGRRRPCPGATAGRPCRRAARRPAGARSGQPEPLGKPATRCWTPWSSPATVNPVRDVLVGGRWVVRDGRHRSEARVAAIAAPWPDWRGRGMPQGACARVATDMTKIQFERGEDLEMTDATTWMRSATAKPSSSRVVSHLADRDRERSREPRGLRRVVPGGAARRHLPPGPGGRAPRVAAPCEDLRDQRRQRHRQGLPSEMEVKEAPGDATFVQRVRRAFAEQLEAEIPSTGGTTLSS